MLLTFVAKRNNIEDILSNIELFLLTISVLTAPGCKLLTVIPVKQKTIYYTKEHLDCYRCYSYELNSWVLN